MRQLVKSGSLNWTPEKVLKGRMAEALVGELLASSGNRVYHFGYEAVLQNLIQSECTFDGGSEIGRKIRSIPDFLVLNPSGKPFFVEAKFRADPESQYVTDFLENIEMFWKAKVILVTLDTPYFRVADPPYFDNEANPIFRKLEDDLDLKVTSEKLHKFNSLVQKYFDKQANWVATNK